MQDQPENPRTPIPSDLSDKPETPTPVKFRNLVGEVAILSRRAELANSTPKRDKAQEKLTTAKKEISGFLDRKSDRLNEFQVDCLAGGIEDIELIEQTLKK